MGKKTKIDWCDSTWNPVTGCLHGCDYCYARKISERFGGGFTLDCAEESMNTIVCKPTKPTKTAHYISTISMEHEVNTAKPYPFYFDPTFHQDRLGIPTHWKKPRNIFVVSMGDLFGDWVPDEWIEEVFDACEKAPQHRYIFLTKNPKRYTTLASAGKLPRHDNMWYGTSTPTMETNFFYSRFHKTFVSIEPILEPFVSLSDDGMPPEKRHNWIIVGAETGNRKSKAVPEKSWITEIMQYASDMHTPLFMKESLRELMGDNFRQEFPWEVRADEQS